MNGTVLKLIDSGIVLTEAISLLVALGGYIIYVQFAVATLCIEGYMVVKSAKKRHYT